MFKKKGKTENGGKESAIVTKESICSTCAVFSFLAFLILCTRTLIFGEVGKTIHVLFMGVFGYLSYPVLLGAIYLSVMGLFGKRLVKNRKLGTCVALTLLFATLIVHTAMTYSWDLDGYLTKCFLAGDSFPNSTPSGLLGGVMVLAFVSMFSSVGAIVALSVLTLFCGYLCYAIAKKGEEKEQKNEEQPVVEQNPVERQPEQSTAYTNAALNGTPSEGYAQQPYPTQSATFVRQPTTHNGQANPYTMPMVTQRPGVSLDDNVKREPNQAQGFSPFAVPAPAPMPTENCDPREVLFGGSPAENYKKNLLFDPQSRVNQRPTVSPVQPTVESSYTPSYTSSYENQVNEQPPTRPQKIIDDRASNVYGFNETPTEYPTPAPVAPAPAVENAPAWERVEENRAREEETLSTFDEVENARVREEFTSRESVQEEGRKEDSYRRHDYMDLFSASNPNVFGNGEESRRFGQEMADRVLDRSMSREEIEPEERRDGFNLLDDEEDSYTLRSDFSREEEGFGREERGETFDRSRDGAESFDVSRSARESFVSEFRGEDIQPPVVKSILPVEEPKKEPPKPRVIKPYVRARLDDFDCRDIQPTANEEEVRQAKENIIATLEEFRISGASISSVTFGPTVTRYNVTIPRGISHKKVVALDQSIAINLHSNGVNIYPNYEDGVVSIEVPNRDRQFVQLGCMLSGDSFVNAKPTSVMFAMGKDVANRKIYGDIGKMIHLLVAGSSGSGKSVFLGSLIISLIYKYSPEELRLILIDPKKTEFVLYNNLPHLMINEIITDAGKAVQSLNWAIGEMNRRYSLFEEMSRKGNYVVNLDQYNEQLEKNERLPKIVIIIDELADLMLAAKKEMEDRIQNLTQKARAAGIHLIVATQRPSTDVITGVIKSNLSTRVAFYVATDVDSRVILDQTGAQKLLGKGDFLYTMPGINVPVRVQSAFISPEESQRIVSFIKNNNEAYYDEEATAFINSRGGNGGSVEGGGKDSVDPMYIDALRFVIQMNAASISMVQRKCSTGYNRAGKIIEWMEDMGYISPFDGAKARKVLIKKEEFESIYGPL